MLHSCRGRMLITCATATRESTYGRAGLRRRRDSLTLVTLSDSVTDLSVTHRAADVLYANTTNFYPTLFHKPTIAFVSLKIRQVGTFGFQHLCDLLFAHGLERVVLNR